MRLINIIESWLKENGYHYRVSQFMGYDCIVYAGIAHSVILEDRILLAAGDKLSASDPQLFEKYRTTLDSFCNTSDWVSDNNRVIRVCISCSEFLHHPHPGIGAGWMVIEEENFKS